MNVQRIQAAIEMMKHVERLDMNSWQGNMSYRIAQTIEELHRCGNNACFAGYLAISEEFKQAGGRVCPFSGQPEFGHTNNATHSIIEYFDLEHNSDTRRAIQSIIFREFADPSGQLACDDFGQTFCYPESYIVPFNDVEPHHVIEKLEALLRGEYFGFVDYTHASGRVTRLRHTFKI